MKNRVALENTHAQSLKDMILSVSRAFEKVRLYICSEINETKSPNCLTGV